MQKKVIQLLGLLLSFSIITISCSEDNTGSTPDENGGINILTATVGAANTEVTNINLENGITTSFPTDCMVVSSRVFDSATQTIGYTNCDNTFVMVDPTTGVELNTYALPGPVAMAVINDAEHILIGTYYDFDTEKNHIIRLDLDNGNLLSDLAVDELGPMYTCTQFFDQGNQTFSLVSSENKIVTFDAVNGAKISEVSINSPTNITHYDEVSNTLISITYEQSTMTNFIEKTNVATGELLQSVAVQGTTNFRLCSASFDSNTNSLMTVNSDNQVQFINVDTGVITNKITLEPEMTPITFWQ